MRLSVSNIGWTKNEDEQIYDLMKKYGYYGLEIAPTRIFPEQPYDQLARAYYWAKNLNTAYGFFISSIQSIWYGRPEKLFGTREERKILLEYTKKAIDFAAAVLCGNLVFGCPINRAMPEGADSDAAIEFFRQLGDYAEEKGTVISMEANPSIYHTNYMNYTSDALELVRKVGSKGFKLNLDTGAMIENGEDAAELEGCVHLINHVHISEPRLKPIAERDLHRKLKEILMKEEYSGFVSIEMNKTDNISAMEETLQYVRGVFGNPLSRKTV